MRDSTSLNKSLRQRDFLSQGFFVNQQAALIVILSSGHRLDGVFTFEDPFTGRSENKCGLAEVVNLSFTTTPSGITVSQIGGLQWKRISGTGGSVTDDDDDGLGVFTAASSAGVTFLELRILSGPSKGFGRAKFIDTVAPSGDMVRTSNLAHTVNTWSVAFEGKIYLTPKDVSFQNLQFREGFTTAVATGYLAVWNGKQHQTGSWMSIGPGNINTGCRVYTIDAVRSGTLGPPYSAGDFIWQIPWEFRVGSSGSPVYSFFRNHHAYSLDASGTAYIEKAGAGPFSKKASDPTSGF